MHLTEQGKSPAALETLNLLKKVQKKGMVVQTRIDAALRLLLLGNNYTSSGI